MSQSWPGPGPVEVQRSADEPGLRQSALIAYVLMLAACVAGIPALLAVILAYIRRTDAAGTVWYGHFQNVITVFWTIFAATIIGFATFPLVLGAFFSGGAWPPPSALAIPVIFWLVGFPVLALWFLYRMIKGLVRASDGRPY
jgi:uncharacterized membrane protein